MEPIFTETASETVTAELQARLAAAVAALPPAHCINPVEREHSESREEAIVRLQNWALQMASPLSKSQPKQRTNRSFDNTSTVYTTKKEPRIPASSLRKIDIGPRQEHSQMT